MSYANGLLVTGTDKGLLYTVMYQKVFVCKLSTLANVEWPEYYLTVRLNYL